jgi:glycosyltransferase involved in cell wall biosynthesis
MDIVARVSDMRPSDAEGAALMTEPLHTGRHSARLWHGKSIHSTAPAIKKRSINRGAPLSTSAPSTPTIAVIGTVGLPASYGGFETLVENLAAFHERHALRSKLVVYCSGKSYDERIARHRGAELRYIPLSANGVSSVLYDICSLYSAVRQGSDVCLVLGVSGAVALPLVRLFSKVRIVTNIDGIEWKRAKWRGLSKWFLRISETLAVRFSDEVIADNDAIAEHVQERYGRGCTVIAYGGDHAVQASSLPYKGATLPEQYALSLCRIEPENNAAMILEAFGRAPGLPLVFVGNWDNSRFGRELKERYAGVPHLHLLDPIYDAGILKTIRSGAMLYVHGHSAGGTNPSLVEMMHFGVPILAYDCVFNRSTTEGKALFFNDADGLRSSIELLTPPAATLVGLHMRRIAQQRYTWGAVSQTYFRVLNNELSPDVAGWDPVRPPEVNRS